LAGGQPSTGPGKAVGAADALSSMVPTHGGETPSHLRIEHLTKRFGAFTALDDISLEIFEREFVCFLGPSGCGKTTLLRAIAGLQIDVFRSKQHKYLKRSF
jgi:iron(III) transport system ATP-binding protein